MKRIGLFLIGILLLLTSCAPKPKEEIVQNPDETTEQEISIVPSYQLSNDNYKMLLPFRPSKARGVVVNQLRNRLDIEEMEDGLRRHSTEFFDPNKYYYEEGQYLTASTVYDWLGRFPTDEQLDREVQKEIAYRKENKLNYDEDKIRASFQQGLNPPLDEEEATEKDFRASPRYLSHILEQNFLERKDDAVELVGVSIGIAIKSEYSFEAEGKGPYYESISEKEMLQEGKDVAQKVLERVRKIEGLENVPIMFALYHEETESSPVPGNFVAKTLVSEGDMMIGDWESTQEEYVLFPSDKAKKDYFDDYELLKSFGQGIAEYFPNYVGYVGEGFYINEELRKLTIEIPLEFYGAAEVVGFTQYTYGLIKNIFPNQYDIEVKISSTDKLESFIYREAGEEEPSVHILH